MLPDVTLMDLRMSVMDGVAAIAAICAEFPSARIVLLTTYDRDENIYRGLQAGAKGYLLKDAKRSFYQQFGLFLRVKSIFRWQWVLSCPIA